MKPMYPLLEVHTHSIAQNTLHLVELCRSCSIGVTGVIKGFNGIPEVAAVMAKAGCQHIASSRIEQLTALKERGILLPTMLIRIPRLCEVEAVARHIDISLNSEQSTIEALNEQCRIQGTRHQVILMLDTGDLREGFFEGTQLVELAAHIEKNLPYIRLAGVGTNLGCYGSIKPSTDNLGELCRWAEAVETRIGRRLDIISGGSSTSLPLMLEGKMPARVNNLRLGEAILNNRDLPDLWGAPIPGTRQDTFILKAQVVEVKHKPTHPIGELFLDAFGNKPEYPDRGTRLRALLAVGRQDLGDSSKLIPLDEGVQVIGGSSDHCIVDVEDSPRPVAVGDVLSFSMFYGPMLFLCTSPYVEKVLK